MTEAKKVQDESVLPISTYCSTYPAPPLLEVERKNIVEALRNSAIENSLVVVSGADGIGKTTLLRQFYDEYRNQCFAYFAGINSNRSNLSDIYLQLGQQIAFYLGKLNSEISSLSELSFDQLKKKFEDLIRELSRNCSRFSKDVFIAVDGFEYIYAFKSSNEILDSYIISPTGRIKIILTHNDSDRLEFKYSNFDLLHLSKAEISYLYSDMHLSPEQIQLISKNSPGFPSTDIVAKRLLASGTPIDEVISFFAQRSNAFFKEEWRTIDKSETSLQIIAIVALSQGVLTSTEISNILSISTIDCISLLKSLPFISLEDEKPIICPQSYISEICNEIPNNILKAKNSLRHFYSSNINSPDSLSRLANFLAANNDQDLLSGIVSLDKIEYIVRQSGDFTFIKFIAESIAETQFLNKKYDAVFDFSVLSTVVDTVNYFSINEFEFNAYLRMKKFDEASNLIEQILIKEEALKYRCMLFAAMQKNGIDIATDLIEDLRLLEESIKYYHDIPSAFRIGASAYTFSREIAASIFKKALGNSNTDKYIDAARSRLALQVRSDVFDAFGMATELENVEEFVNLQNTLGNNYGFVDLEREVQKTKDLSAAILLIINWSTSQKDKDNLELAVNLAIDMVFKAGHYQISIRTLRQLSEFYKHIDTSSSQIYSKSEAILDSIEKYPLEEYYRYKINTGISKIKYDHDFDYWINLYVEIDSIDDLDSRTFIISQMIVDYKTYIESDYIEFLPDAIKSLANSFDAMLALTAEHSEISKEIIENTLKIDIDLAIKFAKSLNTFQRRDYALGNIILYISKNISEYADIENIFTISKEIFENNYRELIIVTAIRNATSIKNIENHSFLGNIFSSTDNIKHSSNRISVEIFSLRYNLITGNSKKSDRAKENIKQNLQYLDSNWLRVRFLFFAAEITKDICSETSNDYLDQAIQDSSDSQFGSYEFSQFYQQYLHLLIKSINGIDLFDRSEIISRAIRQITSIPSNFSQCDLLNRLYLAAKETAKHDDLIEIVQEIHRIIDRARFEGDKSNLILSSSPAIFLNDNDDFNISFASLDMCYQDHVLSKTIHYLMTDELIEESPEINRKNTRISKDNYIKVCDLILKLNFDYNISFYTEHLIKAMVKRNNASTSRESHSDSVSDRHAKYILKQLSLIPNTKFPDPHNIKHDGYKISFNIMLRRLENALNNFHVRPRDFRDIIDEIDQKITNVSDKAYLYTEIAEHSSIQDPPFSAQVLQQASQIVQNIPSSLDRSGRSLGIARIYKNTDLLIAAKEMMKFALTYLKNTPYGQRNETITKNILSLAHSIDPDFASSLISMIENPADKHFDNLSQMAKNATKSTHHISKLNDLSYLDKRLVISQIGEEMYSGLASGSLPSKSDPESSRYLMECVGLDMQSSFPMFAWHMNNSLKLKKSTVYFNDRAKSLSDILDMATHTVGIQRQYNRNILPSGHDIQYSANNNVIFFPAGSKKDAEDYMIDWFGKNTSPIIHIYDPYFNNETLRVLSKLDKSINRDIKIYTLTRAHSGITSSNLAKLNEIYHESIATYFPDGLENLSLSIQVLGDIKTGNGPMHDRFIHSDQGGLDMTTSIDGLGNNDNRIQVLNPERSESLFNQYIPQITSNLKHEYKGDRLLVRQLTFDQFQ